MPLAPHQLVLATIEILMLLVGAWVLARCFAVPELRHAIFQTRRLGRWEISGFEAGLLIVSIFVLGTLGQSLAVKFLGPLIASSPDRAGLEVVCYGFSFHGFGLLAWLLLPTLRGYLHADYGGQVPPATPARRLGWRSLIWASVTTLVLALPVLAIVNLGWTVVLRLAGLPDAPQDLLAVFTSVKSPAVLFGLLFVACVVAPINEELLFRGALFRALRQSLGRGAAYVVSGALFGLMHGNWAGFLPLAVLGAALALAYEQTGDIRVPILAHALFNLNTTLVLLSGLPTT